MATGFSLKKCKVEPRNSLSLISTKNVVIQYSWYNIPIIYGESKYEITGDVYKKVETAVNELENKPYSKNTEADINEADQIFTAEQINGQLVLTQINKKDIAANNQTHEIMINK